MSEHARLVWQIAVITESDHFHQGLYAVADDGTLWVKWFPAGDKESPWERIEELPQPEAPYV